mgnify:CR=1 FL=1
MDNIICYSQLAVNDLDETWNCIAIELCNESAANDTINGILKAIETLKKFPESGAILKLPEDNISGYRFVKYGNYLAFYRTEGNTVYIDRVICSRRDYLKFLF